MLRKLRKFLSADAKEKIADSLAYRLFERLKLHYNREIRFSCELTTKCNIRCDMCTRSAFIKEGQLYVGDMKKEIVERVVEEIKKFHDRGKRVSFAPMGLGEPFLFADLFELFRDIKNISKRISIVLVTNGILLDKDCCDNLISLGVDEVNISLNANNPSDYLRYMGVDMYDKAHRNIENLIKLRNANGKKLPSIFIQYLDYTNNREPFKRDIARWLEIMRYNDKCYIHPVVNEGGFYKGKYIFSSLKENFPCTQPLQRIAIKINGDIYPCDPCFYSGPQKIPSLYLGNIKEESPFELYMRPHNKRLEIIKKMQKDDYTQLSECVGCNTYKIGCNCFFKLPKLLRVGGYKWL